MTQPALTPSDGQLGSILSHLEKHHDIYKLRAMSWRDFLVGLLRVGSSLEHALMVQYLYAAYSLGGPQVPEDRRTDVRNWQEALLTIAREEMGHLLTVQNVITFLGAEVDFSRGNFVWDIEYFKLEPMSKKSLACYVFAEMDEDDKDDFAEKHEIEDLVRVHLGLSDDSEKALLPIGEIYAAIIGLLADSDKIPDSVFRPESYSSQASWDDWGRGYKPDPRPLDSEGNLISEDPRLVDQYRAIVLVSPVATRRQAVKALTKLAVQGEGPRFGALLGQKREEEPCHFERLIEVFRGFKEAEKAGWCPSLPLATNPTMVRRANNDESYISSDRSRAWASLCNVRYKILLLSLMHTFKLARVTRHNEPSLRTVMMHRVFGEMYNLKAIARMLIEMPMTDSAGDQRRVGPPFEVPRDHSLPPNEIDCWYMHIDTLGHARDLAREILNDEQHPQRRIYLKTLIDLDTQALGRYNRILAGLGYAERYFT